MQAYTILTITLLSILTACTSQRSMQNTSTKDTVLLTYHRNGCYGFCPVYQVEIKKNGQGQFIGQRYVSIMDSMDFELSPPSLAEIETIRQSQEYIDLSITESDQIIVDAASLYFKDHVMNKEGLIKGIIPPSIKALTAIVDRRLKELEYIPGNGETAIVQEEIIVQIKPNQDLHTINGEYKTFSLFYLKSLGQDIALYKMILPKNKVEAALEQIKQMPNVVEVQKNHTLSPR
ncbi:DUF6438 domain-containing protein [Membranihabitans marinus]|uniref:DUF6438 domain-containing protein n=1 Tax=Membranihabitans marinus TaxID=1227546 RepID=UPI001F478F49|nr:DUF6438 domain-containing protein [Membranihabitans marinus]